MDQSDMLDHLWKLEEGLDLSKDCKNLKARTLSYLWLDGGLRKLKLYKIPVI